MFYEKQNCQDGLLFLEQFLTKLLMFDVLLSFLNEWKTIFIEFLITRLKIRYLVRLEIHSALLKVL